MRVLFLDVDGVLNRIGFHPSSSLGLRSWLEPELAQRLSDVVRAIGAVVVLASDWRLGRTLHVLRDELRAGGIDADVIGATPELPGQPRWREIAAWMAAEGVAPDAVVIVDDQYEMGQLGARFVRTRPLTGLDEAAAEAIRQLFMV